MRTVLAIALCFSLSAGALAQDFERNAKRCWKFNTSPDLLIAACTWLLKSDRLKVLDLDRAYLRRGIAYLRKTQYGRAI